MAADRLPLALGLLIALVLSGTLTIAGLKAGIFPGVSPLVVLFAWGLFARRVGQGGGRRFLNIAQVAGSAGMAVAVGACFTVPLVPILFEQRGLEAPPIDIPTLIWMNLAGALIGFGFVGLGTRKFLGDPSLPAPEAHACTTLITAAASAKSERPPLAASLGLSALFGFIAPFLVRLDLARESLRIWPPRDAEDPGPVNLDLPFNPIYLGIGALLSASVALLVFGGSFVNLLGNAALGAIEADSAWAAQFPANTMRWVGGGAMTVAVLWSLARFAEVGRDKRPKYDPAPGEGSIDLPRNWRVALGACTALGVTMVVGWLFAVDGPTPFSLSMGAAVLACAAVMVTLGALLSLQIGSSASPVSGTVFVTTLVLCATALFVGRRSLVDVTLITPLLVAACVAVATANDSSQDYKTLQLCGLPVKDGLLAQGLGLLAGALAVPFAIYVAHEAYQLGSADLPAPQGAMFATLVDGLLLERDLPWYPIAIGIGLGLVAVLGEILGARRGLQLPAMALAVGIYLPAVLGVGILIGAIFRLLGSGGGTSESGAPQGRAILTAAGLITGAAAFELLLGIVLLAAPGLDPAAWTEHGLGATVGALISSVSPDMAPELIATRVASAAEIVGQCLAALGIALIGGLIWFNARRSRPS
ncbi:OPT/YSL family transporter [Engelhardtia mirabilis]|uniref:OPT oligopeptide transporter protein n=1 Tax=Engelhardtia mirabilis TaxID=2528011 RepID=A0A518BJB6_9BACT|nr:OPT oligopeptide transporter protein [Planctomycetes bacterium Pla133]QDV01401.1 OPT oligopeptide transporter protein [Planctomycetes bacterium Pla86]